MPTNTNTVQQAKRYVKIVCGFTVLIVGVLMIVTPGPGWLVILFGLGFWPLNLYGRGGCLIA